MEQEAVMGKRNFFQVLAAAAGLIVIVTAFVFLTDSGASGDSVSGIVSDHRGPLPGAVVTVQGLSRSALTDDSGRFTLSGLAPGRKISLSAWKEGCYSALVRDIAPPAANLQLKVVRYQLNDNPKYEWIPPEGKKSCRECHPALTEMSLKDPHLKSARNPRFLTMYEGTDMQGNRSPETRYSPRSRFWSNWIVPERPDPEKPYYGPGFLLDFPATKGNCSACHVPGAAVSQDADPRGAKGADTYGVHCDFCHKTADVNLNPRTKMPHVGVPGVRSMDVRRPFEKDSERSQLFFGTLEDVNAPAHDAYLPLLKESRFCASCHFGVFWNTVVYNSYGEWLNSPYADPKSGKAKTCQACHMPSPSIFNGKPLTNIAPGKGGIERDPAAIHNHNMTVDAQLLRNSLTMTASAAKKGGKIEVAVSLVNDKTGHHVPTDSPLRHLILVVEARDYLGNLLGRMDGPVLPEWCGRGDVQQGHYAGLPGKAYAKLLRNKWNLVYPTAAYWDHTEVVSDNRLAAFASDSTAWSFAAPESGKAVITVRLLYRRAFIELMEQKKWDTPDILTASKRITLR